MKLPLRDAGVRGMVSFDVAQANYNPADDNKFHARLYAAAIAAGTVVMPQVVFNADARPGQTWIVHTGAAAGHDRATAAGAPSPILREANP